jgi:hypothetical protein
VDMSMMKQRRAVRVKNIMDKDKVRQRRHTDDDEASTYPAVLIRVYGTSTQDESNVLSPCDADKLHQWVHRASDRLGLECVSSPRLRRDQCSRKFSLVHAVLQAQAQVQALQRRGYAMDSQNTSDLLCAKSQAYSRPARCWARHLGDALAAACQMK